MQNQLTCPVERVKSKVVTRLKCPVKRPAGYLPADACYSMGYTVSGPGTVYDMLNGLYTEIAPLSTHWVTEFLYDKNIYPGQIVFLSASCGTGKNEYVRFMVENKRYARVLILANRKANRAQIMAKLGINGKEVFGRAVVKSYQSLELSSGISSEELEGYDLIVADEAHYFLSDSVFNPRVNVSLKKVMLAKRPAKIFMSATLSDIEALIIGKMKEKRKTPFIGNIATRYQMIRSKQNIASVACIDYNELEDQIAKSGEKWLIFVDSIKKGEALQKKLGPDSVFICAENSEGEGKAAAELRNLVENEKMQHRVVISTSILDNGITIKDTNLTNIVIDCNDKVEMVQMLGRKRCINSEDFFRLFVVYKDAADLNKSYQLNEAEIRSWRETNILLRRNDFPPIAYSLETEEGKNCRRMIYMDESKKSFEFNWLGYYKLMLNRRDLQELCSADDPFMVKLRWLFDGINMPEITADTGSVLNGKKERILSAIQQFTGETYPVKSKAFKEFQEAFSESFWREFSVDKEENHRSDRLLTPGKIKAICEKYEIPLILEKLQITAERRRVTAYRICVECDASIIA